MSDADARFIPARTSPRWRRWISGYALRLVRTSFANTRLALGSKGVLLEAGGREGPLIVVMNHTAWWDPMVGLAVALRFMPERSGLAPMDADQLQTFSFLRRAGIFGIDPDDRASLEAMAEYVGGHFRSDARPTLFLTPQGRFYDVRAPIRPRPGAAAIAAANPGVEALSISVEYAFWIDKKPDLFIRAEPIATPDHPSTSGWQRAIAQGMQSNADALADLVRERDGSAFEPAFTTRLRSGSVNPIYDAVLALRGRSGSLASSGRIREAATGEDQPRASAR